jgi:cell division protein FtsB
MPTARPATSAARRARTARPAPQPAPPWPRRVVLRGPISRVRWDRLGRTALLAVFALVAVVGAEGAFGYMHARAQNQQQLGIVRALTYQDRRLQARASSLANPATIVREARALGMVRAGERAYVVTGLHGR